MVALNVRRVCTMLLKEVLHVLVVLKELIVMDLKPFPALNVQRVLIMTEWGRQVVLNASLDLIAIL